MNVIADDLNLRDLYRFPWSLTDNGISWLEVTTRCNLACKGCYRDPRKEGHKSLAEIEQDLDVFRRERRSDCMSIAGGDPLVHPDIVEIVRRVRERGWKPIVNTNGLALTKELLREIRKAGAYGFTFHVDTSQTRRDSRATSESGHNELRQKFAEMIASEGGMCCGFNQTVSTRTLEQVPDVVRWARGNPGIVNSVVFIVYREPRLFGQFDWYAGGEKVDPYESYVETGNDWSKQQVLTAGHVVRKIREADPLYSPCAYLNGTIDPDSAKWLIAGRIATADGESLGYMSPRMMEIIQETHHLFKKRWMAYASPKLMSMGRSLIGLSSILDPAMRGSVGANYLKALASGPRSAARGAHLQTFAIIQPIDILEDGRMNMCDGCPDMTVYKGRMYWSCRLEEIKEYGRFLSAVPKCRVRPAERAEPA